MNRKSTPVALNRLAAESAPRSAGSGTRMHTLVAKAADALTVRFGNVEVNARAPTQSVSRKNIAAGQVALNRIKNVLVRPGVTVKLGKDVPLYRADPARPGFLIRTLNGSEQSGKFVGGRFKRA